MKKLLLWLKHIEIYKWLMTIALLAGGIHIVMVLFIIFSRINYHYDLEWIEGASLIEVFRIYNGEALYTQPSLQYIPSIYPPLYFYLSAGLAKIIGLSFLPLRIISFASTFGCLLVIYRVVMDRTNSIYFGFLAAAFFTATFRAGGAWFDIARVDMLFIVLCLTATYFLAKQTTINSIVAGILFSLAFLTKQTAISIFAVMAVSTLFLFKKQTIPFVGSFILVTLTTFILLNSTTNGWYQYYILTLPESYQIRWSSLVNVVQAAFGGEAVAIIISITPLLIGIRKVFQDKFHLYYYFASLGFIGTSVAARINHGGYDNTLVPAYAILSILFGIGISWIILNINFRIWINNFIHTIMWAAIIMQFVWLGYNPFRQIPTQADRLAGDALVADMMSVPGNVLIPYHNYLALYTGKTIYFHFVAFNDVRSLRTRTRPELRNILNQFHSTSFSLIIMDLPDNLILKNHCANTQDITYQSTNTFYPVTGYLVRPTIQYVDCP
jgi:Dolichyl-phosphate-mannose-protein mannosyltransferase